MLDIATLGSANFDVFVVFSEAVSGITAADFDIVSETADGSAGAASINAVAAVGASSTVWKVTIDPGANDARITLKTAQDSDSGTNGDQGAVFTDFAGNAQMDKSQRVLADIGTIDDEAPQLLSVYSETSALSGDDALFGVTLAFSEGVNLAFGNLAIEAFDAEGDPLTGSNAPRAGFLVGTNFVNSPTFILIGGNLSGVSSVYTLVLDPVDGKGTSKITIKSDNAAFTDLVGNDGSVPTGTVLFEIETEKDKPYIVSMNADRADLPEDESEFDVYVIFSEAVTDVAKADFSISAKNAFGDALTGNDLPTLGTPAAVDGETINSKTYSNVWKVSVDPADGVLTNEIEIGSSAAASFTDLVGNVSPAIGEGQNFLTLEGEPIEWLFRLKPQILLA